MLLSRLVARFKGQEWGTLLVELAVVVVGVFIGILMYRYVSFTYTGDYSFISTILRLLSHDFKFMFFVSNILLALHVHLEKTGAS